MKNWRPTDWRNPYSAKARQLGSPVASRLAGKAEQDYEAGADAILTALKKEGFKLADGKGYSVIIPDDD